MPATRSSTRTQGGFSGFPDATTPCQTTFNFARNVTPGTFNCNDEVEEDDEQFLDESSFVLPPSAEASSSSSQSRRRTQKEPGHIPRPPNAFMLFRSDFVKQRRVPSSIETSHGSLSKIIASCWKLLPEIERRFWYKKADAAKAEHKRKYPDYRFTPIHGKKKKTKDDGKKPFSASTSSFLVTEPSFEVLSIDPPTPSREDYIAQCLIEGKKNDRLTVAVNKWDSLRSRVDPSSRTEGSPIVVPTLPVLSSLSSPSSSAPSAAPSRYPSRRSSSAPLLLETAGSESSQSHYYLPPLDSCLPSYSNASSATSHDTNSMQLPPIHTFVSAPSFSMPLIPSLLSQYASRETYSPLLPALNLDFCRRSSSAQGFSGACTENGLKSESHIDDWDSPETHSSSLFQPELVFGSSSLEKQCGKEQYGDGGSLPDFSLSQHTYHDQPFIVHNNCSDDFPNKLSLDFLDAYSAATPFDLLHASPLSTIDSEASSRSSAGSPVPMEREDVQLQTSQIVIPICGSGPDVEMQNLFAVDEVCRRA